MYLVITRTVFLLLLMVGLQACFGGSKTVPVRYYLIDPVDYPAASLKAVRQMSIAIIDLNIPQYLERFHIARRTGESQLTFSDNHQWGESLRKNLLRTLARNLSNLLATPDIATPLNRTSSSLDYRVQVYIEQFELDSDSRVKLVARWQLSSVTSGEALGINSLELDSQQTIEDGNYDQMVSVMQELFGTLSEQIADSVVAQEH